MTCPEADLLIDGEPAALQHAATCMSCRALLHLTEEIRAALSPELLVPEHLIQSTLAKLDEERRASGRWGRLATFVLATFTTAPVIGPAYAEGSPTTLYPMLFLIGGAALSITLLEAWFLEQV